MADIEKDVLPYVTDVAAYDIIKGKDTEAIKPVANRVTLVTARMDLETVINPPAPEAADGTADDAVSTASVDDTTVTEETKPAEAPTPAAAPAKAAPAPKAKSTKTKTTPETVVTPVEDKKDDAGISVEDK